MNHAVDIWAIENWIPAEDRLPSDDNDYGWPTVVYRTPSRLVMECEVAFDTGLVSAALCLVLTIPDVCAHIAGSDYRKWSAEYLELIYDGNDRTEDRKETKTQIEIEKGFKTMENRGVVTASDLYQLRNAIVHCESSHIDGKSKGAHYTPFNSIGISILENADELVCSYGHTSQGIDEYSDCAFHCEINLAGLISRMARGVARFIREDPARDSEFSLERGINHCGIVDFRPGKTLGPAL